MHGSGAGSIYSLHTVTAPQEIPIIGYVVPGANKLARAASFYDALLAEMGVTRMMTFDERGFAWAAAMDKPMLRNMTPYNGRAAGVGNGVMAGIAAYFRDLDGNRLDVFICG